MRINQTHNIQFSLLLFEICFVFWVDEDDDEDEVGLKEKPEDTRYIKKSTSK